MPRRSNRPASKARRAAARPPAPKSQHPITRGCAGATAGHLPGLAPRLPRPGDPDAGLGQLGGARRSEITGLRREDVSLKEFDKSGRGLALAAGDQDHHQG